MLYQALYRKYRPKTFEEVCGQQIITKTLKNMIINNKLTHAYLFIGPRGTGKTSIAKIFAKTINCENTKDGISCEKCDICKMSNNNENVDIIEMDAASNNGVDEIREIKNHVSLMPTFSKYKVYIIDEVHMLSAGAFNALLKTLEEPPKHVIFILATTEPQKVPLTIISRCQCFDFKSVPKQFMKEKIQYICDKESIKIESKALEQICDYSNGGMRDAISLLDQLNSYTNGNIKEEDVYLLNGRISDEDINKIFESLNNNDLTSIFEFIDICENEGKDFTLLCEDIIKYLKSNLVSYQISKSNNLVTMIGKENIINIIYEMTDCLNYMKNIKDKRIYFDILFIKISDILNKQTNVRINDIEEKIEKVEKKTFEKDDSKKIEEQKIEINNNITTKTDYSNYEKLMNIRLNNILAIADKESLKNYLSFINNLESELDNLDERKIFNLLSDCSIKAGSNDGIILTASNVNILNELYDFLFDIEKLFNDKLSKSIKVCVYDENMWNDKRKIYIDKIKNKEKIDIEDESDILNSIINKNDENKSEFDDLLEIGE
ncbi:MAG: DNA polymerase III subunit gamma/tau [Bacilli bacterium]|nr:DNA polymerase III subunit gamma/tau [Bacilli bacterium]